MVELMNKIYLFIFVLSFLNIIRNVFFLVRSINMEEKFILNKIELIILGLSISYVITSIILGITS
jgi:hypothetical protein